MKLPTISEGFFRGPHLYLLSGYKFYSY